MFVALLPGGAGGRGGCVFTMIRQYSPIRNHTEMTTLLGCFKEKKKSYWYHLLLLILKLILIFMSERNANSKISYYQKGSIYRESGLHDEPRLSSWFNKYELLFMLLHQKVFC